jgi:hypothetical protein
MGRLVLVLVATLAVVGATASSTVAQAKPSSTGDTLVRLSCNDGHSVIIAVDQTVLTSLLADVQAIQNSNTGMSCTLDTLSPSSETTKWTVYDYNPSGQAIAPRNSPNSMPATTTGTTTTFKFKAGTFTALLTTRDPSLTGDLSLTTLSDTVSWSGTGGFTHRDGGGCSPDDSYVRFYFRSPAASGSSIGTPPAGFYTQFWWSNPEHVILTGDSGSGTLAANMFDPTEWSDWNGKRPSDDPSVAAAFAEATSHVQAIGLSFGGGCFFENGVTTANGGPFSSTFSES